MLAPLGYYGGPTETMALLPGSPAIGAGNTPSFPPAHHRPARLRPHRQRHRGHRRLPVPADPAGGQDDRRRQRLPARRARPPRRGRPGRYPARSHTITFDPTVFASAQTITLTSGQLELSNTSGTETITGPAAGVTVSGGGLSRVFQVDSGVTASLSGLTISGGSTTGDGGGLYNDGGSTTLTDCTVSGNAAAAGGGLFTKRGPITVISCGISGNTAGFGGGLYNDGGTTTLTDCAVSGNTAAAGGGLFNKRGPITVIGCSVSGNTATAGGGFYNSGTATCMPARSPTTPRPWAAELITRPSGGATLEDTIVATNIGTGGSPSDIGGDNAVGVVGTYDLVGTGGSGGLAGGTGDIVLTGLDGLGWPRSATTAVPPQTMPLLPGSAALDTGTAIPGVTTDQRGVAPGATPDIGAFQSQGFTLTVVAGSTPQARPPAPRSPIRWPSPSPRSIPSSRWRAES